MYTPGTTDPTSFTADCGVHLSSKGKSLSGKYQYKRLVMGSQASSAALYRVMEFVLRGLANVKVYCDDILVYTRTQREHLLTLNKILRRCIKYGIKLAPHKCELMKKKIRCLGFALSKEGIRPETDKLSCIKEVKPPTTKREIRGAVGLFGFFRQFVSNFSQYSSRLTSLTRKNSRWQGGKLPPIALAAFQHLKNSLLNAID